MLRKPTLDENTHLVKLSFCTQPLICKCGNWHQSLLSKDLIVASISPGSIAYEYRGQIAIVSYFQLVGNLVPTLATYFGIPLHQAYPEVRWIEISRSVFREYTLHKLDAVGYWVPTRDPDDYINYIVRQLNAKVVQWTGPNANGNYSVQIEYAGNPIDSRPVVSRGSQ